MSLPGNDAATPDPIADTHNPEHYKAGTLTYTKMGLVSLFFYLLWGDFCFSFMEGVMPNLMPLELNKLDAPNWTIGFLLTSIPSFLTFFVNPVVSFRSDRFRSKWGRRIPFLAVATPFVFVFLALLGFSFPIGRALHRLAVLNTFSEVTVILVTVGVFMVCFQFFNCFINSIYYYLFNDVVPRAFLARMMSLFRVVGNIQGIFYSALIFPHSEGHMPEILGGVAVLYLLGFTWMCLRVKEPEYPPPPENLGHETGVVAAIKTYAAECFTHRYYWLIFIANAFWAMTWVTGPFGNLVNTQVLGYSRAFIGELGAITSIVSTLLLFPAGILADRFHPLRVILIALSCGLMLAPVGIVLVFMRPHISLTTSEHISIFTSFLGLPMNTISGACEAALFMRLLPQDRYGQFCSANAMVRSVALMIGGTLVGLFLDYMKRFDPNPELCYRFVPIWNTLFQSGYVFFYYLVYREWKRLGGLKNFAPPSAKPPESVAHALGG